MSINISEVIWTIICFFVLLFVLKTLLFGPLIRHLDERQKRIDEGLDAARRAEESRDEARREAEESWQKCSADARETIAQAKARDAVERSRLLEDARSRSAETLRTARDDASREESDAHETVDRDGEQLARTLAGRLLSGEER